MRLYPKTCGNDQHQATLERVQQSRARLAGESCIKDGNRTPETRRRLADAEERRDLRQMIGKEPWEE